MHLNELAIGVFHAGLITTAGSAAGASHGHRRAAVNQPATTRGDDHGVGGEGHDLHRTQILPDDSATDAVFIDDGTEEVPEFEFANQPFAFSTADLLVQCIEQLLPGGRSGKCRALVQRAAKATTIEKAFLVRLNVTPKRSIRSMILGAQ